MLPPYPLYFEDTHLLVVAKPGGLLTQPNESGEESLQESLKAWLKVRDQKPRGVFLHALHRLDKPASGLVLFAKSSKALQRLNAGERQLIRKKIYRVFVEGDFCLGEGTLTHWLLHKDHRASVVAPHTAGAKLAILHYRILLKEKGYTHLEVELKTGRYHQIRCQLAYIGHPILGDKKYGSTHNLSPPGVIALHHAFLQIEHPVTHALLDWACSE